jgi:hypothetical protein
MGFTLFQLVYGLEAVLEIESEMPYLKLAVELLPNTSAKEEHLLHLTQLDETHCDSTMANEMHTKCVKHKYVKTIRPCVFFESDLVLLYDQDHEKLGAGKFEPMWHDPYIVKCVLEKRGL